MTISEPHRGEAQGAELREFAEAFREWLPDPDWFELTLWTYREAGRWFALAEEFDITGMGEAEKDAIQDALGLVAAYLVSHFKDHHDFQEALRPVPRRAKMAIHSRQVKKRAVSRLRRSAGREARVLVPPDTLHCAVADC